MKILLFSPVGGGSNELFTKLCIIGISACNVTIGIIIDTEWN